MFEAIPVELQQLNQWVCVWKNSKIPMQAKIKKGASSSDPTTWNDFQTAKQAVEQGIYDNIGFVFADNGIVGIDIDKGYDEDGFISDLAADIIRTCKSYTEVSRSGRGVHILVKGKLPFLGQNNRAGVEIYQSKRYFIMTGKVFMYSDLIENQKAIDYVLEKYFPEIEKASNNNKKQRIYQPIFREQDKLSIKPTFPKIPQGMRNISLTSYAGQLHSYGYSKSHILTQLQEVNLTACDEPLPLWELKNIVESVTRYKR